METKTLNAEKRNDIGKNKLKSLRSSGKIPAVIYGHNEESVQVALNESDYLKSLKGDFGKNTVLDLTISDGKKSAKEHVISYVIDKDALTRKILHVDFLRVRDGESVKVTIPLKFVGVAPGTKLGGTLIKKMDTITIKSIPSKIPVCLEVDLTELNIGDFLTAKDVCGDQFELVTFEKNILVRVEAPRKVQEVSEDEAEIADGDSEEGSQESTEDSAE
tara:strand:+ start:13036 stop:13689 length:654 start_codon:yes stop_codon:yes gene_type:complete